MDLVISPHLDDAVLSCGAWLAAHPGAVVLTLFAGVPHEPRRLTEWDARSGFGSACEAVAERRREDQRALALLGARPCRLDFADGQYGESPAADDVAAAVREVLLDARPAVVLYPIGLFHPDHRLAHVAGAAALRGLAVETVRLYEDVPYRAMPGVLAARLAELARAGVRLAPAPAPSCEDAARKARALDAYASQVRAFGSAGWHDAALPERFWQAGGTTAAAADRKRL